MAMISGRTVAVIVILSGALCAPISRGSVAAANLETAFYIWQFSWSEEVNEGICYASQHGHHYMVLSAELNAAENGVIRTHNADIDWSAFSLPDPCEITPVIRLNSSLVSNLKAGQHEEIAKCIDTVWLRTVSKAAQNGHSLLRPQIDFDCPTSMLSRYRDLLHAVGTRSGTPSITILATWMRSKIFPKLIQEVNHFVVQLHSLERPQSPDKTEPIFTPRYQEYLKQAATFNCPYFVALPTYGYQYAFDADGRFQSLAAEDGDPDVPIGGKIRIVLADPIQVAEAVRHLESSPPRGCRGIVWFRMPIYSNRLNWRWPTLDAVMHGNPLLTGFDLDVRSKQNGRRELWLRNTGSVEIMEHAIGFELTWTGSHPLVYDALHNFRSSSDHRLGKIHFRGPAPRVGDEAKLIGWIRFPASAQDKVKMTWTPIQILSEKDLDP